MAKRRRSYQAQYWASQPRRRYRTYGGFSHSLNFIGPRNVPGRRPAHYRNGQYYTTGAMQVPLGQRPDTRRYAYQ